MPRRGSGGALVGPSARDGTTGMGPTGDAWSFLDLLGAVSVVEDHVDGFSDTEDAGDTATALASFPHLARLLRGTPAVAPRSTAAARRRQQPRRRARTSSHGQNADSAEGDDSGDGREPMSPIRVPVHDPRTAPQPVTSPVTEALRLAGRSRAESSDATTITRALRRTASLYSPRLAPSALATPDAASPANPPRPPSFHLGSPERCECPHA